MADLQMCSYEHENIIKFKRYKTQVPTYQITNV